MEEVKEEKVEETTEDVEVQTTFNEDTIEELNDPECCVVENLEESEGE